jgi:hypothetical protein
MLLEVIQVFLQAEDLVLLVFENLDKVFNVEVDIRSWLLDFLQ